MIITVEDGLPATGELELKTLKDEQTQTNLTEPPHSIKETDTESLEVTFVLLGLFLPPAFLMPMSWPVNPAWSFTTLS